MRSKTTKRFREAFAGLPEDAKGQTKKSYLLFKNNPHHPSLQFKRVNDNKPIYSARINDDFRAVGLLISDQIVWFWVGSHDAYIRLIRSL